MRLWQSICTDLDAVTVNFLALAQGLDAARRIRVTFFWCVLRRDSSMLLEFLDVGHDAIQFVVANGNHGHLFGVPTHHFA